MKKTVGEITCGCVNSIIELVNADPPGVEFVAELTLRVSNAINMALVAKCEPTGSYARGKDAETS